MKKIAQLKKRLQNFLLDLLFPASCQACGRFGDYLCPDCLKKLTQEPIILPGPRGIDKLIAAGDYGETARRRLIKKFKYAPLPGLKKPLAVLLLQAWRQAALSGSFIVVPLPLSRRKERQRGFNQAEELANLFSQAMGFKMRRLLERHDRQPSQATLRANKRRQNLGGIFSCPKTSLAKDRLLLIDDVVATGTTIAEAARVLRAAGAKEIFALVLAVSRLRPLQPPKKDI